MSQENELLPVGNFRDSALFFVFASLCFLAVLAALTAKATYGAATSWTNQVAGEITIQLVDADRRAGAEVAAMISDIPGISDAKVMTTDEMKSQLRETMNVAEVPAAVESLLPVVIHANGGNNASGIARQIEERLAAENYTASVGVAAEWVGDAHRGLGVLRMAALGAVTLLALIALAVIAFATHAALLAQRSIVNVLHLSGATDKFVARLFERRFWILGLRSGAMGALAALGTTAFIIFAIGSSQRIGLLPKLSLDIWDFLILLLTPIIAGFASRFAARTTVMHTLAEAA